MSWTQTKNVDKTTMVGLRASQSSCYLMPVFPIIRPIRTSSSVFEQNRSGSTVSVEYQQGRIYPEWIGRVGLAVLYAKPDDHGEYLTEWERAHDDIVSLLVGYVTAGDIASYAGGTEEALRDVRVFCTHSKYDVCLVCSKVSAIFPSEASQPVEAVEADPEARMSFYQFSVLAGLNGYLFPLGVDGYSWSSWWPARYDGYTVAGLMMELHKRRSKPGIGWIQGAFFELWMRGVPVNVMRRAIEGAVAERTSNRVIPPRRMMKPQMIHTRPSRARTNEYVPKRIYVDPLVSGNGFAVGMFVVTQVQDIEQFRGAFRYDKPQFASLLAETDLDVVRFRLNQKLIGDLRFRRQFEKLLMNGPAEVEALDVLELECGEVLQAGTLQELEQSYMTALASSSLGLSMPTMDAALGVSRLVATVHLLATLDTFQQRAEAVFLFVTGFGIDGFIEYAVELISGWKGVVYQGSEPTLGDLFESCLAFCGVANLFSVLVKTGRAGKLDFKFLDFLLERFVSLSKMQTGDDKALNFWRTLCDFSETVKRCIVERSWDPLFVRGSSPKNVLFASEALLTYRQSLTALRRTDKVDTLAKLVAANKIPREWTTPFIGGEFLDKARELEAKLDRAVLVVSSVEAPAYRDARRALHLHISSAVDSYEVNSYRPEPMACAFVGEPGVGKSILSKSIVQYIGDSQGYPTGASAVYVWREGVNFQDGLTPQHWAILMDDIDTQVGGAVRGVNDHCTAIMTVIDTKPFPVESAAVDDKGKNFGRPLLALYTTNNVDLRTAGFIVEEAAVRRRLKFRVRVEPKPEFAAGVALDSIKAEGHVDIHNLTVEKYSPQAKNFVPYRVMSNTEFYRFFGEEFVRNLERQTSTLLNVNRHVCSVCMIPVRSGVTTCEVHMGTQSLQGGGFSQLSCFRELHETASDVRAAMQEVRDRRVIEDASAVLTAVRGAVTAPARVRASVSDSLVAAGDWIMRPSALGCAAAIGAICVALRVYLATPTLQGRVNNSTQVVPTTFVRVSEVKPLGEAFRETTWTRDQAVDMVRKSIARIESNGCFAHAVRVGNEVFIANHHMIQSPVIRLIYEGNEYAIPNGPSTVRRVGETDVVVLIAVGVPAMASAYPYVWGSVDESYSTFDEVFMITPEGILPATRNRICRVAMGQYSGTVLETDMATVNGQCGLPIMAVAGGRCRMVGIHHSLVRQGSLYGLTTSAHGPLVSRDQLRLVVASIGQTLQGAQLVTSCWPGPLEQKELRGARGSELSLAMSKGAHLVNRGHDGKCHQYSANKSTCVRSPFFKAVAEWAEADLGEREPYHVPILKGAMVGHPPVWSSGMQGIFSVYRETQNIDEFFFPITDYMSAFDACDIKGYEMLSEDEAICGVVDSPIDSINFATSTGPPLFMPKKQFLTNTGWVDPVVHRQLCEIRRILAAGDVPLVPGACTYKDEPIKTSKLLTRDNRVFVCLPAAWNIVSKMYLAPIKLFMRNNPFVSESMVGINMAGDGGARLHARFALLDPTLSNIVEGDYKKMDKSINGSMAWAVVEVFGRLAELLGLDVVAVRLLVWSNFHVMYSIQGDHYQVGGMNPSGSDITVEINAVANALAHRVAWARLRSIKFSVDEYRQRITSSHSFRDTNLLVTYGDDFLLVHHERIDLKRLFEQFTSVGMVVTDGQKNHEPLYRGFADITFLKRQFYVRDEGVFCGLVLPSIYRMLMVFKKSVLSDKDHAAVVLEQAMREIFCRRDADFKQWRSRLSLLADQHRLWDSGYLFLAEEAEYLRMWEESTFSTWDIRPRA